MIRQFDVFANPGRNPAFPFVVVVQSSVFAEFPRRVVVPLVPKSQARVPASRFNPEFRVRGRTVLLHPLEISSVPAQLLAKPLGSLADDGQSIVDALDELLTRAFG